MMATVSLADAISLIEPTAGAEAEQRLLLELRRGRLPATAESYRETISAPIAAKTGLATHKSRDVECVYNRPIPAGFWVEAAQDGLVGLAVSMAAYSRREEGAGAGATRHRVARNIYVSTKDLEACFHVEPNRQVPSRSGLPGRPTSAHLFLAELERRAVTGEIEPSCAREAAVLAQWLAEQHPSAPTATPKTVENRIRSRYRQLTLPEKKSAAAF